MTQEKLAPKPVQKQTKIVELENGKVEYHYPSGHVETFYQCPSCKANNKQSFYSTEHDLRAHISVYHEADPDG